MCKINQRIEHIFICYLESFEVSSIYDDLSLEGAQGFFIEHDPEDDTKKRHIHCYLKFPKKVSDKRIADLFDISPGLVKRCQSVSGYLTYCTHCNDKNKKQYSINDFCFLNFDYDMALNMISNDEFNLNLIYDVYNFIIETNCTDYRLLVKFCFENGYSKFLRSYHNVFYTLIKSNKEDSKNEIQKNYSDV